MSVWASDSGALLVVNGGYFTEEAQVTGLTVVEGQALNPVVVTLRVMVGQ